MSDGEDAAPSTLESAEKPRRITMALIAESSDSSLEPEERAQHVVGLRRLRLGHLNLGSMEGLDPCNAATHIYLQHNRVREIEGLDFFDALQFLVLSHNRLEWVSGVAHLPSLLHLDLSHNSIDDVAEPNNLFPQSLIHLDLRATHALQGRATAKAFSELSRSCGASTTSPPSPVTKRQTRAPRMRQRPCEPCSQRSHAWPPENLRKMCTNAWLREDGEAPLAARQG